MGNPFNYIAINLTNRCNTYCKYCFQSARKQDKDYLNYENVRSILEYVVSKADGKKILHLTGGEPTMNSDFFRILSYAADNDFIVRIQTNGIAWDTMGTDALKLLKNENVSVKISLDGWNEETHEFLRAKGSFQKVVRNIEMLTKYSCMIGIKTCIHEKNIGELYKMLEFCRALHVQGFSYNMLRREGEAQYSVPEPEFHIEELEVARKLIPYFNKPEYQYLMNGNNLLLFYYCDGDIRYQHHFYIDYDGRVYPHQSCVRDECLGNVFIDGVSALDAEKTVKYGHSHMVDRAAAAYVKEHFIPINKRR